MAYCEVFRGVPEGRMRITGAGPMASVTTELVDSTLDLSAEQLACLPDAVGALRARGIPLTDGPTYRLESWTVGESLHLRLSRRSYFDSVLLKRHPEWNLRSQVLAVVAVTLCPQGYLVERRSAKVAALPGRLHPLPSGSVEPPSSPLETLLLEAEEELGLLPHELNEVQCLGLVFGEESGVYQLVGRAITGVNAEEIAERNCSGAWEKDELIVAPGTPEELSRWLRENGEKLTIGGRVAMVMEGGYRWGSEWLEANLP